MAQKLAIRVHTAFGLAFDIEKDPRRKSGFAPAQFDLGAGKDLFGDLRLEGLASMLRIGFVQHLVLVGGNEARYKDEKPVINRAAAIRQMLILDHGILPGRVSDGASNSNTLGNIALIKQKLADSALRPSECAVVSNLYHLPRAHLDLLAANLPIPIYAAEAFWLIEDGNRKENLIERLGGGSLAERYAIEAQGIADKVLGKYKSRTDASPIAIPGGPVVV